MTPVSAIFDIGKTNKKFFLFDEEYTIVFEKSECLAEIKDEDGDPCEDLQRLTDFIFDSLDDVFSKKEFDIKAINFSAYGSALVYIDESDKALTPLYNYLKKYPDCLSKKFHDDYGDISLATASPALGSLNSGMQIYRMKYEKPEIFKKIKYALHLPQYLSYLISKKPASDITSIGCHTMLWDFKQHNYHAWVKKEKIDHILAPIVSSDKTHLISYRKKNIAVGTGLHDSSAALIPYLKYFHEPFVLISTGTWCISLNPFNQTPLTAEELNQDCLCYLTPVGHPVKASRLFLGQEHDWGTRRLAVSFPRDEEQYLKAYRQLMVTLIEIQVASTRLVLGGAHVKNIFINGGFAKNEVYMKLLAGAFKDMDVSAAQLPQASALGAAMQIHKHWNRLCVPAKLTGFKKYLVILLCLFCQVLTAQQKANWISVPYAEDSIHPCPVFRKTFNTGKPIKSAILYITAHGIYEAKINGIRVGKDYFTPGFTSYDKRLQYQEYNVTSLIRKNNDIRVTVADGWWRGVFGGDLMNNRYGMDASLLFQLDILFTDGSKQTIISDKSCQVAGTNILCSNIYNGEIFDACKKTTDWTNAIETDFRKDNLVPSISPPVRKQERFKPLKIFKNAHGEQIIDFGQNMAGWVELTIKGHAGDTIKLFHAEALDKDGNFYTGNLREATAEDIYILKEGEQTLEPHFTYHGFRYVKAEGFTPTKENCMAIALHTDLKHTGTFSCSDPMINKLQRNIEWSLNSNFFDIPTDCPQRSERLGWSGDAEIFCATAAFNRDVKHFFEKWLGDLRADQGVNGGVSVIIPDIYHHSDSVKRGVAGWGDAATIIPWTLFQIYGDTNILRVQYASMKAWVDYIESSSYNYLWKTRTYGDWYAPGPSTNTAFIDQCFFGYSTQLVINAARVLDHQEDIIRYTKLLQKVKEAFLNQYTPLPETQTAYILALQFDMLPDSLRPIASKHLTDLIHQNDDHLATGFLGTPYILEVLTKYGYRDLAYQILNQKTIPSWLYPITKGATTIWEKWDAIKEDGSFDTCSLNHYAYGAVGKWLYEEIAGIKSASPGYKKIIIEPHPGGGLTWAKAGYMCKYGKIISEWKIVEHKLYLYVAIPKGTSARVFIPGNGHKEVGPGEYHFTSILNNLKRW